MDFGMWTLLNNAKGLTVHLKMTSLVIINESIMVVVLKCIMPAKI